MSDTFHQTVGVETMSALSSNAVLGGGFNAIHAYWAINRSNSSGHFLVITLVLKLDKWFKDTFKYK